MSKEKTVQLSQYSVQELVQLKNGNEQEVQRMLQTYQSFRMVHNKTENDKILVTNLVKVEDEQPKILIPLSNSLYIPGVVKNKDHFVIDIGTGYVAERTAKQTLEHLNYTGKLVVQSAEKVVAEIEKKQSLLDQINIEIQRKLLA